MCRRSTTFSHSDLFIDRLNLFYGHHLNIITIARRHPGERRPCRLLLSVFSRSCTLLTYANARSSTIWRLIDSSSSSLVFLFASSAYLYPPFDLCVRVSALSYPEATVWVPSFVNVILLVHFACAPRSLPPSRTSLYFTLVCAFSCDHACACASCTLVLMIDGSMMGVNFMSFVYMQTKSNWNDRFGLFRFCSRLARYLNLSYQYRLPKNNSFHSLSFFTLTDITNSFYDTILIFNLTVL